MIARESSPPSGKPTNTLAFSTLRSLGVHFSSTAPEEKKNTSYGVIAAANSDTAKKPYVPQSSPVVGANVCACRARCAQSVGSLNKAMTKMTSARPARPNTRSRVSNFTRHNATHSTTATSGTHSR